MAGMGEALALAYQQYCVGRLMEAETICRQVLAAAPGHADALHLLGLVAHARDDNAAAVELLDRAVALNPSAEALVNLGNAWKGLGQLDPAIRAYRRAVALKPDSATGHNNLGNALREQGLPAEAVACFRRAIRAKPDFAAAHNNLGNALRDQGEFGLALEAYHEAVRWKPDFPEALFNVANVLRDLGEADGAAGAYGRCLELKPDFAAAHNNLGSLLKQQGRLAEALASYRRAVARNPDHAGAHNNLGNALRDAGDLDDALACYRRALAIQPDFAEAYSNLLFALQYRPDVTPSALREAHAEFDRRYGVALRPATPPHSTRGGGDRLRLGFVSADFGCHPVGRFLVRVLENLDRRECDVVCYSDREPSAAADRLTDRFQSAATLWRTVARLTHVQLADRIRADRVDVLFDLAGHTTRNRLLVFAHKPAPVQITWLGYVGTTGLSAMDYLLADRYEVPPGTESCYCEKILRLPDSYVAFDAPDDAPPVGPLPALGAGCVTFGCFNNPAKINPPVVAAWSRILHKVPGSRMVLKYCGVDDSANADRIGRLFAAHGVGPDRLGFCGASGPQDMQAGYSRIDVALDTFPYGGGLTTCEALWMGVPVVTWPGETFAGRHSLSHLSTVGLVDTIARDLDDYLERAVGLARDLPGLAALRAGLRARVASSPLCDGARLARNLLALLRQLPELADRAPGSRSSC